MQDPLPLPPPRRPWRLRLSRAVLTVAVLGLAALGGTLDAPAGAAPSVPDARDPWASVPLRWSVARALLTPARCEQGPRARRACVHAIEAALRTRDARLRLRPSALARGPGEVVVRTFGAAAVVRGEEGGGPNEEARARALVDAWDAVPPAGVPFERLAAWVAKAAGFGAPSSEGPAAPHEAAATARAVEAFLRTSRDPFLRLVPRAADTRALRSTGAERVGVGVSLLGLPGVLLVERVAAGGPAARAGVQPGDVLVSIDGWDLAGLDAADAARLLEGPQGTTARLGLRRDGRLLEIAPRRARVSVPHAFARLLRGAGGERVGYLRIASFYSDRVCDQAGDGVRALERGGARGLVLDLRGNPGGLVEQTRCVADLFLGPHLLVGTLERVDGPAEPYETRTPRRTALPLVVLVDAGTMSAAELLAAALRAHGRALVAGERTYGKASVQDAFPWAKGLSVVVYRTVGVYTVGPDHRRLHLVGLTPDVLVDTVGRRAPTRSARRAAWRYWEALRRPPPHAATRPHGGEARPEAPRLDPCVQELDRERWMADDGEAVGPQLAAAASATRCAPAP